MLQSLRPFQMLLLQRQRHALRLSAPHRTGFLVGPRGATGACRRNDQRGDEGVCGVFVLVECPVGAESLTFQLQDTSSADPVVKDTACKNQTKKKSERSLAASFSLFFDIRMCVCLPRACARA